MFVAGLLRKMRTVFTNPVTYFLRFGNEEICLNELLGRKIGLSYTGVINCIKCGRETKNSFAQGYCYKCFISAPETEACVLRPELCRAHEGIARDMEYARENCLIEHIVYLAQSPELKVGVTRHTQIPTRWIDQGAERAIVVAKTPNRYLAGMLEVALKDIFSDKTNWRNMLTGNADNTLDLQAEKWKSEGLLPYDFARYFHPDDEIITINFPVLHYPAKVKSVDLDKNRRIEGRLIGIKGQYLIFEDGEVINIRKYGGYNVIPEIL